MRLLHIKSGRFEEFFDEDTPIYAILSHTWGKEEMTYDDCKGVSGTMYNGGSAKIDGCCRLALEDGHEYVWIDTICIDKSSSAELSEAINSMFAWYKQAEVCYVYLSDVPSDEVSSVPGSAFRKSRWFKRGWTLQELIAPRRTRFYSNSWGFIQSGGYDDAAILTEITGIPEMVLVGSQKSLENASIAQKMSWAAGRSTKRKEDRAYSLLGLFGVNMPMLYGEGDKAFLRLQEEIMKSSDDQSLFAWGYKLNPMTFDISGMFAPSPDYFCRCEGLSSWAPRKSSHYFSTNKGLRMEMSMTKLFSFSGTYFGRLNVRQNEGFIMVIPLVRQESRDDTYTRSSGSVPIEVSESLIEDIKPVEVYIQRDRRGMIYSPNLRVKIDRLLGEVTEVYPPSWACLLQKAPSFRQRQSTKTVRHLSEKERVDTIYVRVHGDDTTDFVVRILYTGVPSSGVDICDVPFVKVSFAKVYKDMSMLQWKLTAENKEIKWYQEMELDNRSVTASLKEYQLSKFSISDAVLQVEAKMKT